MYLLWVERLQSKEVEEVLKQMWHLLPLSNHQNQDLGQIIPNQVLNQFEHLNQILQISDLKQHYQLKLLDVLSKGCYVERIFYYVLV